MSNVRSLGEFRKIRAERDKQKQEQQGEKEKLPKPTDVDQEIAQTGAKVAGIVPQKKEGFSHRDALSDPQLRELAQICKDIRKIVKNERPSGRTYEDALKLIRTYPDSQLMNIVLHSNVKLWKQKPVFFRAALDEINRRRIIPWTVSLAEKAGLSPDDIIGFS